MKNVLKWMGVILIPYILMLVLHFIIPLQFILQSNGVVLTASTSINNNFIEDIVRSNTLQTTSLISNILSPSIRFINSLSLFFSNYFNNSASIYGTLNENVIILNNAFQYSQTSFLYYSSMWFATNATSFNQLNHQQQTIYKSYLQIQSFLQCCFPNISFIQSVSFYISQSSNIAFQYPSQASTAFSNINASPFPLEFQITLSQQKPLLTQSGNLLVYCQQMNQQFGVFCLRYFLPDLMKSVALVFSSIASLIQVNLLELNLLSRQFQIFASINSNNLSLFFPSQQSLSLPQTLIQSFLQSSQPILVYQNQNASYITLGKITIIGNLICFVSTKTSFSNVIVQETNKVLNILLIPCIILVAGSVLISVLVLRYLLNSMNKDLTGLKEQTRFVAGGDFKVDIKQFDGAQDVQKLTTSVASIVKLFCYASLDYFQPSDATRILKYIQTQQILRSLKYNDSAVLENIAQCYLDANQEQKAINCIGQSIQINLKQLLNYGGIDEMTKNKQENISLPVQSRGCQIQLIRKFVLASFCFSSLINKQFVSFQQKNILKKQWEKYLQDLIKISFPDFQIYAQVILTRIDYIRALVSLKELQKAQKQLRFVKQVLNRYERRFFQLQAQNEESLVKTQSKETNFTSYSNIHPYFLHSFLTLAEGEYQINDNLMKAFDLFNMYLDSDQIDPIVQKAKIDGMKRLLQYVNLSCKQLQGTLVSKQILRIFANSSSPHRQFLFLFDCSCGSSKMSIRSIRDKALNIFDRFISPWDRISLLRFNSDVCLQTLCNLTQKDSKELILKKVISTVFKQSRVGKNNLPFALKNAIKRISHLKNQKIVIVFLHSLPIEEKIQVRSKNSSGYSEQSQTSESLDQTGDMLFQLLLHSGIKNCTVLVIAGVSNDVSMVKKFFGFNDLNKRLSQQGVRDNIFAIIGEQQNNHLERILGGRQLKKCSNTIFALVQQQM